MTPARHRDKPAHLTGRTAVDYAVLVVFLCVLALRLTFAEGPPARWSTRPFNISDNLHSLILSSVLLVAAGFWLTWAVCTSRKVHVPKPFLAGLLIFMAAAVVAGIQAGDKRTAITSSVTMAAPMLMAVVLIRILDSPAKIRLVLTVVVACGVVSAYQCAEQFFFTNPMMVAQYDRDPNSLLGPLGIEPGSFEQTLFEHRLYSRGPHGFFTTANSAGSFALLALGCAAALLVGKLKTRNSDPSAAARLVACAAATATIAFGLFITASKGAILALVPAAVVFAGRGFVPERLAGRRRTILVAVGLIAAAGVVATAGYGLKYGRLPGGNSMLVRWQYWKASAQMYADHPLTGVGGGNFGYFYTRYKPASAPESVCDPHNFVLSVLTQFGPAGAVGFLIVLCWPVAGAVLWPADRLMQKPRLRDPAFHTTAVVTAIAISTVLLAARPLLITTADAASPAERQAAFIMLFLMPVIAFIAGFGLAAAGDVRGPAQRFTIAALAAGLCGVIVHNLVDFAIFEPGLLTCFMAVLACIVALSDRPEPRPPIAAPPRYKKLLVAGGALLLAGAYIVFIFRPVAAATGKIRRAQFEAGRGNYATAHKLLAAAADDDRLSPVSAAMNAALYIQRFEKSAAGQHKWLEEARQNLLEAIARNPADYKHFEHLADVYVLLAENSVSADKDQYYRRALLAVGRAVELYPGCGRLHYKAAQVAERINNLQLAEERYRQAVRIEDSFREQFRQMYPGRKIVSRLGEERYSLAKQRLSDLQRKGQP